MEALDPTPSAFNPGDYPDPIAVETAVWKPGELEFTVSTYVTGQEPPDHLVTSARCIVLRGSDVLMLTERDGVQHILPGGRREYGESVLRAVKRELKEETNITGTSFRQIGFTHFRHLRPRPPGYAYPYPDFLQVIFATAAPQDAHLVCDDEWAVEAAFQNAADAMQLLPENQRALLQRAKAVLSPATGYRDESGGRPTP